VNGNGDGTVAVGPVGLGSTVAGGTSEAVTVTVGVSVMVEEGAAVGGIGVAVGTPVGGIGVAVGTVGALVGVIDGVGVSEGVGVQVGINVLVGVKVSVTVGRIISVGSATSTVGTTGGGAIIFVRPNRIKPIVSRRKMRLMMLYDRDMTPPLPARIGYR
jgi:hypothetical protein